MMKLEAQTQGMRDRRDAMRKYVRAWRIVAFAVMALSIMGLIAAISGHSRHIYQLSFGFVLAMCFLFATAAYKGSYDPSSLQPPEDSNQAGKSADISGQLHRMPFTLLGALHEPTPAATPANRDDTFNQETGQELNR